MCGQMKRAVSRTQQLNKGGNKKIRFQADWLTRKKKKKKKGKGASIERWMSSNFELIIMCDGHFVNAMADDVIVGFSFFLSWEDETDFTFDGLVYFTAFVIPTQWATKLCYSMLIERNIEPKPELFMLKRQHCETEKPLQMRMTALKTIQLGNWWKQMLLWSQTAQ